MRSALQTLMVDVSQTKTRIVCSDVADASLTVFTAAIEAWAHEATIQIEKLYELVVRLERRVEGS